MYILSTLTALIFAYLSWKERKEHGDLDIFSRDATNKRFMILFTGIASIILLLTSCLLFTP